MVIDNSNAKCSHRFDELDEGLENRHILLSSCVYRERSDRFEYNSKELRVLLDPGMRTSAAIREVPRLTIPNDKRVIGCNDAALGPHVAHLVWAGRTTMLRRAAIVGNEWNGQAHSIQWYGPHRASRTWRAARPERGKQTASWSFACHRVPRLARHGPFLLGPVRVLID